MIKNYLQQLLGENEEILLTTRQHWLVLLSRIFPELLSAFVILILVSILWVFDIYRIYTFWGIVLTIVPLISMIRDIVIWINHQYIVTNHRVIQIMGIYSKHVTDSSLEKVNDVKMSQSILGRIFGYADIEILTASEIGINRFSRLGNPIRFKTVMLNAKERLESRQAGVSIQDVKKDIPQLISQLDTLRQQNIISETEFQQKKVELLAKL